MKIALLFSKRSKRTGIRIDVLPPTFAEDLIVKRMYQTELALKEIRREKIRQLRKAREAEKSASLDGVIITP